MNTCSQISSHTDNPADTISLDETARHRRRMMMVSDNGIEFLLDLPEARLLRNGEGLVLDDGRVIRIIAVKEELYTVRGRDARHLLVLAWQIGNRHLQCQILEDRILIRRDHVIRQMLEGLGAEISVTMAPFDPERGAYDHGYGEPHFHDH